MQSLAGAFPRGTSSATCVLVFLSLKRISHALCPKKMGGQSAPPKKNTKNLQLLKLLQHCGELQFRLGQGFYYQTFRVFRSQIASGCHFAD